MSIVPTDPPVPIEAASAVSDFTLQICAPLYWHDRRTPFPKKIIGGSCFILRFANRLVGVTAAHVVHAYENAREQTSTLVCQLRLMEFALHDAIIDRDDELDIATFALSEAELQKIEGTAVDCRQQWPPPKPDVRRGLSLAGFPQETIVTSLDRSVVFGAYGGLTMVEDVSERDILITYDPSRERQLGNNPLPPLGFNMSGCSGGPVLMQGTRNGLLRWFPVGIINAGPRRTECDQRGDAQTFDMIRARRIHFIREDGTIDRPASGGWLPGRR